MIGATAVAGGFSAAGAYEQGQAQKNMMNYQSQAALTQIQNVQNTSKANISGVQDQAALTATMLRRRQAEQTGQQTAAEGAQGIGGSKTAGDIAKDTFSKQQLDQMTLQYNANVKTWGITNNANAQIWGLASQAGQYGMGAENAAEAGDISTAGSLLNTASQIGTESYFASR